MVRNNETSFESTPIHQPVYNNPNNNNFQNNKRSLSNPYNSLNRSQQSQEINASLVPLRPTNNSFYVKF